jgi:hypothetical protein
MTFVGDGEYPLAMQRLCRLLESYVLEERVDGSQARIPCAGAVFANPFQVFEEQTQEGCVEIFDQDFRRYLVLEEHPLGAAPDKSGTCALQMRRVSTWRFVPRARKC